MDEVQTPGILEARRGRFSRWDRPGTTSFSYSHLGEYQPSTGSRTCHGTSRSLVAFDVDRTVLHQGDPAEKLRFRSGIGRTLVQLARLDYRLAAITGNSLVQLSSRFISVLLEELCSERALDLIPRFHFFCNGAAMYIQLDPRRSPALAELLARAPALEPAELLAEARRCIFDEDQRVVHRNFVFASYARQCCIPEEDAKELLGICAEEACSWWESMTVNGLLHDELRAQFYVATGDPQTDFEVEREANTDSVNTEAAVFRPGTGPKACTRTCMAADGREYVLACNILPVLSFRHARSEVLPHSRDPRIQLIRRIKQRLRHAGLVRYIVVPGGRGTIDISHHLVNKRSALTWLLRHLGVEGVEQLGEPIGANAIYFGDEVVLHGNDLPVTEIPGILTFAVNELTDRVPFRTNIEIPTEFTDLKGPDATQAVLEGLMAYTEEKLATEGSEPWAEQSAVAAWKEQRLQVRLHQQCAFLLRRMEPSAGIKVTYRRLEAAVAAVTALTQRGAGLDDFADQVIELVDSIGRVANQVRERQFRVLPAQGARPADDDLEDDLLEELAGGVLSP